MRNMTEGIHPLLTQEFLMTQPEVVSADVWFHQGELTADVVIEAGCRADERELQRACLESLGLHQTPRRIRMARAFRPSA